MYFFLSKYLTDPEPLHSSAYYLFHLGMMPPACHPVLIVTFIVSSSPS